MFAPIAISPPVNDSPVVNVTDPLIVIVPEFAFTIPPVATNGVIHSAPAVLAEVVLYCKVALDPYDKDPVNTFAFAPFSMDKTPLTVVVPEGNVLAPVPDKVRLEYVVAFIVCAAPL